MWFSSSSYEEEEGEEEVVWPDLAARCCLLVGLFVRRCGMALVFQLALALALVLLAGLVCELSSLS